MRQGRGKALWGWIDIKAQVLGRAYVEKPLESFHKNKAQEQFMSDMSDMNKATLLGFLRSGKDKAVTGPQLANLLGIRDTRAMRLMLRELISEGHLIGLSVRNPKGYYLIETPEELKECMATMKSYCVNAALHRRDLKRAAHKLFGQQVMMI
jgi:hypothetical protein|tara:strand:- start:3256 stop:3711 length:456 start_codon:yes stop_codon:yes gene_type:complete